MPLPAGKRLGSYEILGVLGAGGMGEVYRARDTRLDRTVAIKIMPAHLAGDADFRQRFEREARAISSLSHPHICTLYDVGSEDGVEYLVMEYLEGETLAQRLLKGPLPLAQVLRLAVEIAAALDRAHRQGVTHRDLKPGNIMLTKSGAKLLDFGLARLKPAGLAEAASGAPTALAAPLTARGTILGTLQYMAPEQVEGKPADQRADIFAFGAIVYEMVTGRRAFEGDSQASLIGAILRDEPRSMSALQPLAPATLDALIATCLAKEPDERWQSAGDLARQLRLLQGSASNPALAASAGARPASAPVRRRAWTSAAWVLAAFGAGAVLAGSILWHRSGPVPPPVTSFVIIPPPEAPIASVEGYDLAISPDGRRIAWLAVQSIDHTVLFVRDLASLEARAIQGSERSVRDNSSSPFFSADGQSIVYQAAGQLVRIPVAGGPPARIADTEPNAGLTGGFWTADDVVVYAESTTLLRVSAGGGGTPEVLTPEVQGAIVAPVALPGGRALLFGSITGSAQRRVVALDLTTGRQHVVVEGAENAAYLPSGHLVFARGSTLMAQAFDADALEVRGEAVAVQQGVRRSKAGAADFAVSASGTLAYVPGGLEQAAAGELVFMDRTGRIVEHAVTEPAGVTLDPRLSPDGQRVLASAWATGTVDAALWVYDLTGRPPILLAGAGANISGVWSTDGRTVAFLSNLGTGSAFGLYTLPADGSVREPHPLPAGSLYGGLAAWTREGDIVGTRLGNARGDIVAAGGEGAGELREIVATADAESYPALSSDERWLAFASDRTGRDEIWAKRMPDGVPVRVSRDGGQEPVWSKDGRELYYLQGTTMMAVPVDLGGDALAFEAAVELFSVPPSPLFGVATFSRRYDVTSDGRFLMLRTENLAAEPAHIVVIENWIEEVKRRVPAR